MKAVCFAAACVLLLTAVQAELLDFDWQFSQTPDKTSRSQRQLGPLEERRTGRGSAWTTTGCQSVTSVPDIIRAEFPLDNFYQKYTHAYGIPIISSTAPDDTALIRACYVVRFLLSDRKDLRDAMYDAYGRVGVIGLNEKTNDIPEHSYLSDSWNDRARGLGGTLANPISTNGEENLLCFGCKYPFDVCDRWEEEDVLVHEFSHAIHLVSLKLADSGFDSKLRQTFDAAKLNGLWGYTYAGTRHIEYFAEGAQSFFDVQTHRDFRDNVHNNISTRASLKDYDRPLYDLLVEVFPCMNLIVDRCDNQDLAANQQLRKDCPPP